MGYAKWAYRDESLAEYFIEAHLKMPNMHILEKLQSMM